MVDSHIEFIVRNDGVQTGIGHNLRNSTIVRTVAQHRHATHIIRTLERWRVVELFASSTHNTTPRVGIGGILAQLPLVLVVCGRYAIAQRRGRPDVDVGSLTGAETLLNSSADFLHLHHIHFHHSVNGRGTSGRMYFEIVCTRCSGSSGNVHFPIGRCKTIRTFPFVGRPCQIDGFK